jgi:predicted NBD/HSP70 family sugar kinase
VYIATLFGGGIVANREVLRGANGNAGELAELLPPGIYPHPNLNLLKTILDRNNQPYESVIEMLDKLDLDQPGVDEWVHYCKNSLTLVMSSCAALLDTQAIIIGGRITEELTNKLLEVSYIYAQNRRKSPRALPVMISAKAEGDPVAIGAAAIPFRHFIT